MTSIEHWRILELLRQNLSQRVITNEIVGRKTLVAKFLKDPDAYGTKKYTFRPKKILLALGLRIRR